MKPPAPPKTSAPKKTPPSDVQAQVAGDSGDERAGAEGSDDSATAASRAMKQTSKTPAESGDKRSGNKEPI